MKEPGGIRLSYFNTIGHEYHWFLAYEFLIHDQALFDRSDKQILARLLSSKVLGKDLYHDEMDGVELELKDSLKKVLVDRSNFPKYRQKTFNS